ncbi:hypothetical protein B9Z55_011794 [Caenorhabditis nigoni]|uniref:THAP-type domain-containing protein n=1 Tax=Caenorhabditis nigoni TaxID=1611254 RepID=A0A2G5UMI0_9PELO|nr:hypothetical protein B9Z55_011794 [Caenorhabditis nigoni]
MSEDPSSAKRRRIDDEVVEEEEDVIVQDDPIVEFPEPEDESSQLVAEESGPLEMPKRHEEPAEPDVDIVGDVDEEETEHMITPEHDELIPDESSSDELMRTPTKKRFSRVPEQDHANSDGERVFSNFPCQVIPETLGRMTRTPPEGENLIVYKNANGRLRIFVEGNGKSYSVYSNLTHKPCTVCNRIMKIGEMHLNFPADLDRRRIWANLLGFKYKDILRSKMGPVSFSIAAGPICTEHFAEECFRNHNFNKSAIEAFGVPVAISPDVKTTPSKKSRSRVPWVCTICDFHSCSVVELQTHLLDHTEEMLKKKDSLVDVPEAGFMCPFCRKCTYGYKTISGYRRHLNAGPIHHCHLRRIYEFAKMNCRATELDPVDSWDNWTRRNVYVAYHGCEPPANEIVLTPSPTKKAYAQNPEERTKMVHDAERRKKAVRSLSFVGKEGGTSVNDHNVMQRQVYLQIRRELEHAKKTEALSEAGMASGDLRRRVVGGMGRAEGGEDNWLESMGMEEEPIEEDTADPQAPMGSAEKKKTSSQPTPIATSSVTSSPVKKPIQEVKPAASAPQTPVKKRKIAPATVEPKVPPKEDTPGDTPEEVAISSEEARERQKLRDEQFAEMVQKRSQQVKRLINAKKFKKSERSPQKPRKALQYTLMKGITSGGEAVTSSVEEGKSPSTRDQTPEASKPSTSTAKKTPQSAPAVRVTRSQKAGIPTPPAPSKSKKPAAPESEPAAPESSESSQKSSAPESPAPESPRAPEERPLKSMLARSLTAGVRPSMAKYHVPLEAEKPSGTTSSGVPTGAGTAKSISTGAILQRRAGSSSPGGIFSQRVMGAVAQEKGMSKRPSVLARRPLILSPRKRGSTTPRQTFSHHESSPIISTSSPMGMTTSSSHDDIIISAKDLEVGMIEEVIDSVASGNATTSDDVLIHGSDRALTLVEALAGGTGSDVKDQDFEEITKKMNEDNHYYRAMEDAIRGRTVTKMRADMRLSRQCIRQIEAARARARLFGEGSEGDYQIWFSNDGAQVLHKNNPKWKDPQDSQQPGPSTSSSSSHQA